MDFKAASKTLRQNKDLLVILAVFLGWLVIRQALKLSLCSSGLCWLEPSDWPSLLGVGPSSARILIVLLAFVLFAAPTGWASIVATLVAIDLMLGNGFSLLQTTLLFSLATGASLILTWRSLVFLLGNPGPARRFLTSKALFASRRMRLGKGTGIFWFLAFGNAVSSQIHFTALAQVLRVPFFSAFPPLFLGSLFSFFIPLAAFYSAKALTLDGVAAALLGLGFFGLARHLATRKEAEKNDRRMREIKRRADGRSPAKQALKEGKGKPR